VSDSTDNPYTPEIIVRLVAKMTELDVEVTKFASTRIGILSDLSDIESRVSTLEEQSIIIRNKLEQHKFPALVEEFVAHEKSIKRLSPKAVATRKKL